MSRQIRKTEIFDDILIKRFRRFCHGIIKQAYKGDITYWINFRRQLDKQGSSWKLNQFILNGEMI